MKALFASMMLGAGFLMAAGAQAQVPAGAPAGTTATCKDGSYFSGATKKGACKGHKGVKDWYGTPEAAAAGSMAAPATKPAHMSKKEKAAEAKAAEAAPAAGAAAAMPSKSPAMPMTPPAAAAPAATPMQGHAPHAMPANPNTMAAAPGGGAGQVWVNAESKVYHCQDDRYYGKTKKGEYMSEADAIAKGNHASHGKACSAK